MSDRQKKAIIYLHKIRRVPISEIAYLLGISRETVRKIIRNHPVNLSRVAEEIKLYNSLGKKFYQMNIEN